MTAGGKDQTNYLSNCEHDIYSVIAAQHGCPARLAWDGKGIAFGRQIAAPTGALGIKVRSQAEAGALREAAST